MPSFELLLEDGRVDVNFQSKRDHFSALMLAARYGNLPLVRLLLSQPDIEVISHSSILSDEPRPEAFSYAPEQAVFGDHADIV
jgi:ankyrin repeat protein